jgi:hypothetical protein
MAITAYTYSVANDFPGGAVDTSNLWEEISASGSGITIQLDDIQIDPNNDDADRIDIIFKNALSTGEKTTLDNDTTGPAGGLIAAHDNVPKDSIQKVDIGLSTTSDDGSTSPTLRATPQAARPGYYMCDRDIKLCCGQFVSSNSYEDLKHDPATNLRADWGEVTLVGVYKDDAGSMVACTDQADVDNNGILSVWDYQAKSGGSAIELEIRGGGLSVATGLSGANDAEKWEHQLYVIMAPGIPVANGGQVRFFDGYMKPFEGETIRAVNPSAVHLNPNDGAGGISTVIRVCLWYPIGAKDHHILRLITYRSLGTF